MNSKKSFMERIMGLALCFALLIPAYFYGQDSIKLDDAEIASVAVTANQIDVNYARLALEKKVSVKVEHFANSMIQDHNAVIKMAGDLAAKLGVTPKDNALTQQLLKGEKETTATLTSLRGKKFERAYVDNEVAYHDAVISAIKDVLMPQTQNEELKALFVNIMPVLEAHLQHAKDLQAELK